MARRNRQSDDASGRQDGTYTREKDARDLNAAQREKLALDLRMQGYDFAAIAEACGYTNSSAACKAWKRAIRRIPQASADEARRNMQASYDMMRRALYEQTRAGKTWAIEAWLKVDEREARLLGLDAKADAPASAQLLLVAVPQDVLDAV